jgi:streptomycin 6-kinase
MVQHRLQSLEADWERLGKPFDRAILEAAVEAGQPLATTTENLAVNGDLHGDQVLRGAREPWLAVDPLLLRGDIAYDLARILWTRIDEMPDDAAIRHWFGELVAAASLDRERARAWVIFRTVDYWLWGLSCGLTEDPVRCARLAGVFA